MSVSMIGPKFYAWDNDGKPLAFGKVYTYKARTNAPKDTYQSEDGVVANTNPVILNGEGYANIYLDGSYKIVVKDADNNERWTTDPVTAQGGEEWVNCVSASYLSPKSFKVTGNVTNKYDAGRRVRVDNAAAEYAFSTIDSSIFAGGETAITVIDSVVLTGVNKACVSIVGQDTLPISQFKEVFEGVSDAVSHVSALPNLYPDETGIKTLSYRNKSECAELGVDYPDGGGATYVVASGTYAADAGSVFDAGIKQLKLASKSVVTARLFGALSGIGDASLALERALSYADSNRLVFDFLADKLLISRKITIPSSLQVRSGSRASVEPFGGYTGDGIFVSTGNGAMIQLPNIANFSAGAGLTLDGTNVTAITMKTISGCKDGLRLLSRLGDSVLDNNVTLQQIGGCTNGIVFESDAQANIMQGNEIKVNFVSACLNTLVFRDNGTHTSQANWDSNNVITQAVDPIGTGAGAVLLNESQYSIPRCHFRCEAWLGGLDTGARLIKGSWTGCDFDFSFAQRMGMERIDITSVSSLASCTINIRGGSNFGAGIGSFASTIATSAIGDFNGGKALYLGNNAVKVIATTAIGAGQSSQGARCFHFLSKSALMPFFTTRLMSGNKPVTITAIPAGTEEDGLIRLTIVNNGIETIQPGDEFLINLKVS